MLTWLSVMPSHSHLRVSADPVKTGPTLGGGGGGGVVVV